eukprot:jgi/Chrzof1/12545/UNPLg00496.t1
MHARTGSAASGYRQPYCGCLARTVSMMLQPATYQYITAATAAAAAAAPEAIVVGIHPEARCMPTEAARCIKVTQDISSTQQQPLTPV